MIPYEVDPSLHSEEPHEPMLDDGFSRPEASHDDAKSEADARVGGSPESLISEKSDF